MAESVEYKRAISGNEQVLVWCGACELILYRDDYWGVTSESIAREVAEEHEEYSKHDVEMVFRTKGGEITNPPNRV